MHFASLPGRGVAPHPTAMLPAQKVAPLSEPRANRTQILAHPASGSGTA